MSTVSNFVMIFTRSKCFLELNRFFSLKFFFSQEFPYFLAKWFLSLSVAMTVKMDPGLKEKLKKYFVYTDLGDLFIY